MVTKDVLIVLAIAILFVALFVADKSKGYTKLKIVKYSPEIQGPGLGHNNDYATFDEDGKFVGILFTHGRR